MLRALAIPVILLLPPLPIRLTALPIALNESKPLKKVDATFPIAKPAIAVLRLPNTDTSFVNVSIAFVPASIIPLRKSDVITEVESSWNAALNCPMEYSTPR